MFRTKESFRVVQISQRKDLFNYLPLNFIETGCCCLQEVLDYVIQAIGGQERRLLSRLSTTTSKTQENLKELKNVTWQRLSVELERLGRADIVKHIIKNTLITEGIIVISLD